jgi:ADP-heptose:LPS heptosyltransferase
MSRGAILVIRGGAMGDFIVTLPVLTALRERFPETRIELVAYPGPGSLAVRSGLAHGLRPIESRGLAGFFARVGPLDPDWSAYFAGFHVIFSFLYDPDRFFQNNVSAVTKAQFISGPHRPDETKPVHVTEQFLAPLERLAIFDADPVPRLRRETPPHSGRRELAIHPGSSSESKNWPEVRWQALIQDLVTTTDLRFLLLGGEAEGDRLNRLARLIPTTRRDVWNGRPLPEVAARLEQSTAFLGHDTGPGHLAAALDLPGLTLWGATNDLVWRPRSNRFQLLKPPGGLATLEPATVRAALSQIIPLDSDDPEPAPTPSAPAPCPTKSIASNWKSGI